LDYELFIPPRDLFGCEIQALASVSTFLLRRAFLGDVSGDDNFRTVGELNYPDSPELFGPDT